MQPEDNNQDVVDLAQIENPADKMNLPSFGEVEDLQNTITEQAKTATESVKGIGSEKTALDTEIESLLGATFGESGRRVELAEATGRNAAAQRQQQIQQQMFTLGRNLDTAQIQATEEVRGTRELNTFLDTRKQQMRNQAAVQSNRLAAESFLLEGSIANADAFIESAIAAEFEPIKQTIELKEKQLESIKDDLTRAEKREWDTQQNILAEQKDSIEREEEARTAVFDVAKMAQANGAPSSLISKITAAETREEALALVGRYGTSIADRIAQAKYNDTVAGPDDAKAGARKVFSIIDSMLENEKGERAVGSSSKRRARRERKGKSTFRSGSGKENFNTDFKQLKSTLTFELLPALKGAISDKDLELLETKASALSLNQSDDKFLEELAVIQNDVATAMGSDPTQMMESLGIQTRPSLGFGNRVEIKEEEKDSVQSEYQQQVEDVLTDDVLYNGINI